MAPCGTSCGTLGESMCQIDGQWGMCIPPPENCSNNADDDCDGIVNNGCNGPGLAVTYRYFLPPGETAQLTIFDEADDGNGSPILRPVPFGQSLYDTHYAWGTATDTPMTDCYAVGVDMIECTVHRPVGAHMHANVDLHPDWACDSGQGNSHGLFEVFVQGQPKAYNTEAWWDQANQPNCRYIFTLP